MAPSIAALEDKRTKLREKDEQLKKQILELKARARKDERKYKKLALELLGELVLISGQLDLKTLNTEELESVLREQLSRAEVRERVQTESTSAENIYKRLKNQIKDFHVVESE